MLLVSRTNSNAPPSSQDKCFSEYSGVTSGSGSDYTCSTE